MACQTVSVVEERQRIHDVEVEDVAMVGGGEAVRARPAQSSDKASEEVSDLSYRRVVNRLRHFSHRLAARRTGNHLKSIRMDMTGADKPLPL